MAGQVVSNPRASLRGAAWSITIFVALACAALAASCSAGSDPDTSTTEGSGNGGSSTSTFTGSGGSGGSGFSTSTGGPMPGVCDPMTCEAAGGTCTNNICTIDENPGGVDDPTQDLLDAGGTADAAFKFLYPYDQTVFPRGLIPPTLQFDGVAPDAMLVRITFNGMDYTGYYGGANPGRLKLSDALWTAVTLAADGNDDVKVDVTKISGGQVSGPVTEHWTIAQGSLRGTIYYEAMDSPLAGGAGSVGIMKLEPNAAQPTVLKSGCGNVCHTASADGSTLVASTAFPNGSASYDLTGNNAPTIKSVTSNVFTYGGIYPDGSFVISATNYRTWVQGFPGNTLSRQWDVTTGAQIPNSSWDSVVSKAGTPAFAPDGTAIAFNHEDTGGGRSLATMQYDVGTNTFSGLTDIATDPSLFLGWPAFTPDAKWVIYHAGTNNVFETNGGAFGDLWIVNAASKVKARLDLANGYANGQTYLPANDPNRSFAPTVLPVAVGGYYWMVFTSHRSYGNTLPSMDNNGQNGKLWIAAIDIDASDGIDASHPAFFLDGQEYAADNLRGFWVLSPCKSDGEACESGIDCCGGYCTNGVCSTIGTGCSNELEICTTSADCCEPNNQCINGHCAQPPPQ